MARAPQELSLFVEKADRLYLRPAAFNSHRWGGAARGTRCEATPSAEYLGILRGRIDAGRLRDCGFGGDPADVPDGALAAAAMAGVVMNPAFLDIVDETLVRAPCLCCCYALDRRRAELFEVQAKIFLGYYSQDDYLESGLFYRVVCGLVCDVAAESLRSLARERRDDDRRREARGGREPNEGLSAETAAALKALGRVSGVLAVCTRHEPASMLCANAKGLAGRPGDLGFLGRAGLAFCVYATPEGRKYVRRLTSACAEKKLVLSSSPAASSGYEFFCMRHKLRMRAVEVYVRRASPSSGAPVCHPATDDVLRTFWATVQATARGMARAAARKKRRRPSAARSPADEDDVLDRAAVEDEE